MCRTLLKVSCFYNIYIMAVFAPVEIWGLQCYICRGGRKAVFEGDDGDADVQAQHGSAAGDYGGGSRSDHVGDVRW